MPHAQYRYFGQWIFREEGCCMLPEVRQFVSFFCSPSKPTTEFCWAALDYTSWPEWSKHREGQWSGEESHLLDMWSQKSFLYLCYTSSLMAKGIDTKASRKVRRNYMRGSPGSGLWGCYLRSNWFLPIFSCPLFLRRCSNPIVSVYPLWCLLPCLLNSLKVNGPRGRIWWMGDKECKRVEVSVLGGLLWCKGPGGKRCFQLEFHWTGLW